MQEIQSNPELEVENRQLKARLEELEKSQHALQLTNEKLQVSEDLLFSIMNNSPNVILVKDLNHRYVLINQLFEKLLKLEQGWIKGRTDYDLFPPEVAKNCIEFDDSIIQTEKPVFYEMVVPLEDGEHTYFENKFPLYNRNGSLYGLGAISTDITELKKAEDALRKREAEVRQSQKMEAIGRLAGGIAHDFNNLLTVIIGYAELMLLELSEDSRFQENLNGIKSEAERATSLVKQLLAFSRQQVLRPTLINLNMVVVNLGQLLSRVINENIELSTILEVDLKIPW